MKKFNLWLFKIENKISRFAIERLMTLVSISMLFVLIADTVLFVATDGDTSIYNMLVFDRNAIFHGQIWRIFTFIFLPPDDSNIIFSLLGIYFFYWTGNAVENRIGKARFNLFYFFGIFCSILVGLVLGYTTNIYLNLSIFLAFCMLFPDTVVLLFFILPIKIKWLGIVEAALLLLLFIFDPLPFKIALLVSFLNLFIFFGSDFIDQVKRKINEYKWKKGR